jgi:alanine racemase
MRAVAEIDLSAIRNNVAILKKRSGNKQFMAVVKANAYGHGAVEVAHAAVEGGATWLGVATIEEGIQLTEGGITREILVLSEPEAHDDARHALLYYDLTPVVYSREFIEILPLGMKVHLKVDTGMHRVGIWTQETQSFIDLIEEKGLKLEGIMTHFAAASNMEKTNQQIDRFNSVLVDAPDGVLFHAANTEAVLYRMANYDMARCGLGVYGLIGEEFGLKPAMSFRSRIASINFRHQGTEMSYTRVRKQGDGFIGVIPVGYADGIPLRSAGRGWVSVAGRRFPIVAVTMDMSLVDFGRNVFEIGEPVEIIGSDISGREWATWLDTTPYEVACGIGSRVKREYVRKENS